MEIDDQAIASAVERAKARLRFAMLDRPLTADERTDSFEASHGSTDDRALLLLRARCEALAAEKAGQLEILGRTGIEWMEKATAAEARVAVLEAALRQAVADWSGDGTEDERSWLVNARAALTATEKPRG